MTCAFTRGVYARSMLSVWLGFGRVPSLVVLFTFYFAGIIGGRLLDDPRGGIVGVVLFAVLIAYCFARSHHGLDVFLYVGAPGAGGTWFTRCSESHHYGARSCLSSCCKRCATLTARGSRPTRQITPRDGGAMAVALQRRNRVHVAADGDTADVELPRNPAASRPPSRSIGAATLTVHLLSDSPWWTASDVATALSCAMLVLHCYTCRCKRSASSIWVITDAGSRPRTGPSRWTDTARSCSHCAFESTRSPLSSAGSAT